MIQLNKSPGVKRLIATLALAPDYTLERMTLCSQSKTDGSNMRRIIAPLIIEGFVREHKTSTHLMYSLTQSGIETARAFGLCDGAGPSDPVREDAPKDYVDAAEPSEVELAARLLEIARQIAPLKAEQRAILSKLAGM